MDCFTLHWLKGRHSIETHTQNKKNEALLGPSEAGAPGGKSHFGGLIQLSTYVTAICQTFQEQGKMCMCPWLSGP